MFVRYNYNQQQVGMFESSANILSFPLSSNARYDTLTSDQCSSSNTSVCTICNNGIATSNCCTFPSFLNHLLDQNPLVAELGTGCMSYSTVSGSVRTCNESAVNYRISDSSVNGTDFDKCINSVSGCQTALSADTTKSS